MPSPVHRTDVVIAGGGAFGLSVAAVAATMGPHLQVTLLERDVEAKSNAEVGSGSVIAAGTRQQMEAGVDDSPDILAQDIIDKSHGRADKALTQALTEESRHVVHWLIDEVGVPLTLATEARRIGHSRLRLHATPERSGERLIGGLRDYVRRQPNVDFRDHSPAVSLRHDGVTVMGITASTPDGVIDFEADATVLASGGFAANRELLGCHVPLFADAPYIGVSGHQGDALRWAQDLGAPVKDLQSYLGHGYVIADDNPIPAQTRLNPGIMTGGGIMVNTQGQRFAREDQGYSEWAEIVRSQPGGIAIAVWDEEIHQAYAHSKMMQDAMAVGAVTGPVTSDALAATFDLPTEVLQRSIVSYNDAVDSGTDALGRQLMPKRLEVPLYAAKITGAIVMTLGGVRVDTAGRVEGPDGRPVQNLYAGGAAAAGLSGGTADGYLSGAGLLMSIVLGSLVGKHLAGTTAA